MVKEFILTLKSLTREFLLLNILSSDLYLYILENTLLLLQNAVKEIICCLTALKNSSMYIL